MAAKAVAFTEALRPEFARTPRRSSTTPAPAEGFVSQGLNVLTGGTDNHLLVLDVASTHGITGRQAEDAVRRCGITLNRNPIPFDPNGPWYTSGLRFGTAAVTTLGMGAAKMKEIASIVALVLKHVKASDCQVGGTRQDEIHLDDSIRIRRKAALTTCSAPIRSTPNRPAIPSRSTRSRVSQNGAVGSRRRRMPVGHSDNSPSTIFWMDTGCLSAAITALCTARVLETACG